MKYGRELYGKKMTSTVNVNEEGAAIWEDQKKRGEGRDDESQKSKEEDNNEDDEESTSSIKSGSLSPSNASSYSGKEGDGEDKSSVTTGSIIKTSSMEGRGLPRSRSGWQKSSPCCR